jgi:hypothetical protein
MAKRHVVPEFIVTETASFESCEFSVVKIPSVAMPGEVTAILGGGRQRNDTA